MQISKIVFPSQDSTFDIAGDLFVPDASKFKEPFPGAVIIAGSGPVDRYGNGKTFKSQMYKLLADYLCEELGFLVVTYDKRGVAETKGPKGVKHFYYCAGIDDLISDALQAFDFLLKQSNVDQKKCLLLGHSEGGILLPRIYLKSPIKPHGVVFISSVGETLKTATDYQKSLIAEEVAKEKGPVGWILRTVISKEKIENKFNQHIEKIKNSDKPVVFLFLGLIPVNAKWQRDHFLNFDSKLGLQTLDCHVLAITGDKDAQCRSSLCEESKVKEFLPNAASISCFRPPLMSHILRQQEEDISLLKLKKLYPKSFKKPLDPDFLSALFQWVQKRFRQA